VKTVIDWKDPTIEPPPFNTRILALLGGSGSNDFMQSWTKYAHIADVVIKRSSPNDDGEEFTEYDEFTSGESEYPYAEYQFHVVCEAPSFPYFSIT
jgi:hypothetical protein